MGQSRTSIEAEAEAILDGKPAPAGAAWEPPIPLDEPAGAAPQFPFHLLPPVVTDLVHAVAESVYCPPDYPAVAALAAASSAIGAAFTVQVKADFVQGAGLYCCIVGDPSVKKSPPIRHVLKPIVREQVGRVERMDRDNPPAMYAHGEGEIYVGDTTVEGLAALLQQQPRGVLLYRPELIGWLLSMNQYKAKGVGADRSFFLEVYDSEPITIHRKGAGPIFVGRPSLTMIGATTPDSVRDFFDRKDGLSDRILWSLPPMLPARGERFYETDPRLTERWGYALQNLWAFEMRDVEGHKRPVPNTLPLLPDGRDAWRDYTDRLAAAQNHPDFPARLKSAYGKLEGAAARLALVLQLLAGATGERIEPDGISGRWVEAGGEMAMYFGDHARRVQRACGTDARLDGAKRILAWARGRGLATFTRAELWRSLRNNPLFDRPESLAAPLKLLEQHFQIRWLSAAEQGVGRPASPGFELNPVLLTPESEGGV